MTSPIPRPPELYAVPGATENQTNECVDCAAEEAPAPAPARYTVRGTALCRKHAVRERNRLKEEATAR